MANSFSFRNLFQWRNRFASSTPPAQSPQKAQHWESVTQSTETLSHAPLNTARVYSALTLAESGQVSDQVGLVKQMIEHDAVIHAHLQTRRLAITGKNWSVNSQKFPEIAEICTRMLQQANIQELIQHLSYHILWGYSGVVTDWNEVGDYIRGFLPIQPACFEFDEAGNPALYDLSGVPHKRDEFPENQLVILTHKTPHNIPALNGLARPLLHLFLLKQSGIQGWNRFIEKFGIPLLMGRLPSGTPREELRPLLNALSKMSKDGVAATIGEESNLQIIQANNGGTHHELFCRYIDELITMLILGQRASSDTATGMSNGNVQGKVRQDLIASDASYLINVIQEQWINPYLKYCYNLDAQEHDITFWIDYAPAEDLKTKAELCVQVANATGKAIDVQWAESYFGVKLAQSS